MQAGKIVLVPSVIASHHVPEDFIGRHLHFGVDLVIVQTRLQTQRATLIASHVTNASCGLRLRQRK